RLDGRGKAFRVNLAVSVNGCSKVGRVGKGRDQPRHQAAYKIQQTQLQQSGTNVAPATQWLKPKAQNHLLVPGNAAASRQGNECEHWRDHDQYGLADNHQYVAQIDQQGCHQTPERHGNRLAFVQVPAFLDPLPTSGNG